MNKTTGTSIVFDPSQTTITIDNIYITGIGATPISFSYNQDAVSAESGLDGAVVFSVNNSKLGTCTLSLKVSSPQYEKLMSLAKNHKLFSIQCTDKSSGRRAGGNSAMFTRVPDLTADPSDVTFTAVIAELDIETC